jgi:hypothetical protein
MTLKKAIEVLKSYQSWRLGEEDVDMQKPSVVTEAINTLLDFTDSPEFFAVESKEMIEISDEEIKQKAYSLSYKDLIISIKCFIKGCEWYRDQLKQKS